MKLTKRVLAGVMGLGILCVFTIGHLGFPKYWFVFEGTSEAQLNERLGPAAWDTRGDPIGLPDGAGDASFALGWHTGPVTRLTVCFDDDGYVIRVIRSTR